MVPILRRASIAFVSSTLLLGVEQVRAQSDSGKVTIAVRHEARPLLEADVRSDPFGARTDASGTATLTLPAGRRRLIVAHIGFRPDTIEVDIRPQVDTLLTIQLLAEADLAPVIVTSTRMSRRLEDEPVRVEVLAGDDVAEKMQMRPADLSLLLREMSGVRMQPGSPVLGATNIRIQGLAGRYTAVLSDGLPLYGAQAGGLSLVQVPPVDLRQAEVIKGAATALYGPAALGGVVNLVSRPPAGERAVVLNQTSRSGTDGVAWLAQRVNQHWGFSVLGGAHRETEQDADPDGWADLPGVRRAELRPRLYWNGTRGGSLFATLGATTEARTGGTLPGIVAPDGRPFVEGVNTNRIDGGLVGVFPVGAADTLTVRAAATDQWQRHEFGPTPQHDRRRTLFSEATLTLPRGRATWLLGAAIEHDGLRVAELSGFDYSFTTPSLFAQSTFSPGRRLAVSASGRCDAHNRYGTICSPRVSALFKAPGGWSARLSAATGFFAPTPLTGETEAIGLSRVRPPSGLRAERARYTSLDLTKRLGALEINGTLFASTVAHAVQLETLSDTGAAQVALVNASGPTRTYGGEVFAVYAREPMIVTLDYGYLRATEVSPETGARREVPLNPRHSAGIDVAWESDESGTRVGVEVFFTGRQALEHDPYRTTSAPYATIGVLVSQRVGRATVYLNGENLTDVRQTRYDPLLLPTPAAGGRWTTDAWAPLEGRLLNGGVRLSF